MFRTHVTELLSAYCHDELAEPELLRVREHLQYCVRCQQELGEIRLGIRWAEHLPVSPAPASLWLNIQHQLTPKPQSSARRWSWSWAVVLIFILGIGGWAVYRAWLVRSTPATNEMTAVSPLPLPLSETTQPSPRMNAGQGKPETLRRERSLIEKPVPKIDFGRAGGWEVERVSGTPRVGAAKILKQGKLGEGEWLETDNDSRAQVRVAEIGFVTIDPNSRLKLVRSKTTEHRVNLAQGKLSAFIIAPPRLFVVETPSATAIDLGCAYTLEVDPRGNSILQVTSGWVSLMLHGQEAIIPAGAMCVTKKGIGVGTPHFADATPAFKAALEKIDFSSGAQVRDALLVVLAEARTQDALTLWHLLRREYATGTPQIRNQVFDRLELLAPPPDGVTRDGIVQGDRSMLELWFAEKIR